METRISPRPSRQFGGLSGEELSAFAEKSSNIVCQDIDKGSGFQHAVMREMPLRRKATSRSTAPLSLAARLGLFSSRRQEIIRPAFEHPRGFVLLSVRALAKRLKTDPATMIRIVRGMQFRSYRDFQHWVHELVVTNLTSLASMQRGVVSMHNVRAQTGAAPGQQANSPDAG